MNKINIYFLTTILSIFVIGLLFVNFEETKETSIEYKTKMSKMNKFSDKSVKTILFWNSMFGNRRFYYTEDKFEKCPVHKNCISTFGRHIINEENFDAILFHGISDLSLSDLPKKRSISQRYVFVSLESPANRKSVQFISKSFFNVTMTYSMKSDIMWPYSNIVEKKSQLVVAPSEAVNWNKSYEDNMEDKNIEDIVKRKTNMAVWFRSNCDTKSGREDYVEDLENYLNVDKIGNCELSDKSCPTGNNCFENIVEPNYYFYLSFENSFCKDYVTEKLFNALRYNVVPVVYGAANYNLFAPPHSYINALDFESPKALAKYLLALANNQTEYLKYFWWKKYYEVQLSTEKTMCDLCYFLHERTDKKIYEDISSWYGDNECPIQRKLSDQIKLGGVPYVTKKTIQNTAEIIEH